MANWRPENPYYLKNSKGNFYNRYPQFAIFEAGADAMHKADVEWLEEKLDPIAYDNDKPPTSYLLQAEDWHKFKEGL